MIDGGVGVFGMTVARTVSWVELFLGVVIVAANLYHVVMCLKRNGRNRFLPIRVAKIVAGAYVVVANVEFTVIGGNNHYNVWMSYLVLAIVVCGVSILNLEKIR
jgi:hypothetical protein